MCIACVINRIQWWPALAHQCPVWVLFRWGAHVKCPSLPSAGAQGHMAMPTSMCACCAIMWACKAHIMLVWARGVVCHAQ